MDKYLLCNQVKSYERAYMSFMSIEKFPPYSLHSVRTQLDDARAKGFGTPASVHYSPQTNEHILTVSSDLTMPEYLIFHEFTHILDVEEYAKADKWKYASLSGFMEYHASQVELLKLTGALNITQPKEFTMRTMVTTFANTETVQQYVNAKYQLAHELFSRSDFPADFEALKVGLGVLYNYWGLRSVCEIHAPDFVEKRDNDIFTTHIPSDLFCDTDGLMHGWLNNTEVIKSMNNYLEIMLTLAKNSGLA